MRIKNKKSRWEGTVDAEGWKALQRAGLSKNYDILDKSDDLKVENVHLPEEVIKFQGRLQEKQQVGQKQKSKTGEQPTGKSE